MLDALALKLSRNGDDNFCMINTELEQLQENIDWQRVLRAYQQKLINAKAKNPEDSGWIERLKNIAEVEQSELSPIHGKLIALGFLKFELSGRETGVQYQLTSAGQRAINSLAEPQTNAA